MPAEASRAARESVRLGSEKSIATLSIHVVERHIVGTSGKSVFSKGSSIGDVARMIKETVENGVHRVERRGDNVMAMRRVFFGRLLIRPAT